MSILISPSLLSADFLHLEKDLEMINQSEADWLHLDIMDGVFVPNISFGFPVIDAVAKVCKKHDCATGALCGTCGKDRGHDDERPL